MSRTLRIGTRESALALWQAHHIEGLLRVRGVETEIITVKSDGELDLVSPLYEMGVQGIFTKTLDIALLHNRIDIAVHSLKDVPTQVPQGLKLAAVPKRASSADVLVHKGKTPVADEPYLFATSSLRRSAQWLHRFPKHRSTVLRGNIQSRINKLIQEDAWDGALFAAAGIERVRLEVPHLEVLTWMIPAPSQGALGVVVREDDTSLLELCTSVNHLQSQKETEAERMFLRLLMGGCSMPIGALARVEGNQMSLLGCVLSLDGTQMASVSCSGNALNPESIASKAVTELLHKGGREIIAQFDRNPS